MSKPRAATARPLPNAPTGAAAAVFALRLGDCRWPLGDPQDEDFRFCMAVRANDIGPYCLEHAEIARE